MCAVLNISPKTYYKYRNKEDSDYYDYLIIKEIFDDSKGTYGYRRIVEGLKIKYEVIMNGKKVLRIMKKYNLMAEYIKKSKKKNSKIRYKLKGKRVLASIDNDLQQQVDDYIYNTYIVEDIDEIVFMGDCATWIKAFPNGFKYHKDMKITFSMDGFHLAQAITNIATKAYPEVQAALKQACYDNNMEDFIYLCDSLIELKPSRAETINKKKEYILNNWKYIQIYYHKNPMKCSMEAHISHCFADIFTSRPRAYSEKGLRHLLKLRLLKLNDVDIQMTYFKVIKGVYDNVCKIDSDIFNFTFSGSNNNYQVPQWLSVTLRSV